MTGRPTPVLSGQVRGAPRFEPNEEIRTHGDARVKEVER
jgi:hypothetical protein